MKKLLLFSALLFVCSTGNAQKKHLGHDIYDGWKNIPPASVQISENGSFITYEVKPTVGDGLLVIYDTKTGQKREIERGSGAQFFGNQKWLTYKINPAYAESRKAQLDKVAKEKMPKPRTYLLNLATGDTINVTQIENPAFLEKAPLMVFLKKETPAKVSSPAKADSTTVIVRTLPEKDSLPATAVKPDPKKPKPFEVLFVVDVEKKDTLVKISHAEKYSITKDGTKLAYSVKEDSLTTLNFWNGGAMKPVFELGKATMGKIVFDTENSNQFAFTVLPADTLDKQYALYNVPTRTLQPRKIDFTTDGMSYTERKDSPLEYSKQGSMLIFDIAPAPQKPEKDTLLASEKFVLDLWSYTDTLVPTQQMKSLPRFENSYSAMYNVRDNYGRRLGYGPYIGTYVPRTCDVARFFLMTDSGPYEGTSGWDQTRYRDYYLFWPKENKKEPILTKMAGVVTASPLTRWVVYFDTNDRAWYSLDPDTKQKRNLTAHLGVNFYDELHDTPGTVRQAGAAGWTRTSGREYFMVYDRYDVWLLDPSGRETARRLTDGRGSKTIFRPVLNQSARNRYQSDTDYINELSTLLFTAENEETRESGFWSIAVDKNGVFAKKPAKLIEGPYKYTMVAKAKEADRVIWTRQKYNEFPDLHTSNQTFTNDIKISNANPELKDYLWGTAEIIRWQDKDGKQMKGILYLPENYDPAQKYPALVYIYEKLTDRLHSFHTPAPSWSIIIPPMYTSNGYAILMPDIEYEMGYPCRSALDVVVSAAEELVRRGIAEPDRIGINGQSWGGAQLNYIVTQTDAFRCASIGAGVSNMISGYGNVRGDSGTPRAFLYETGQSRIGGTIWDMPQNFIDNSAVFHLPNVNTPILLRHSDNDEAVNFSQGLEMFNGLRRLGKPVWLLNYNNGGHNLREWAMRKDFSVRMQQFFDHYLKDQPLPRWMVEGININERGKELKLDLVE